MIRDNLVVLSYHLSTGLLLAISGLLPGQGPLWRVLTMLGGLIVAGWGAWLYLFDGWHLTGYRWLILFVIAAVALTKSVIASTRQPDPVPYPAYSPLRRLDPRSARYAAPGHVRRPAGTPSPASFEAGQVRGQQRAWRVPGSSDRWRPPATRP
jgi:hypothetical protein